MNEEILIIDPEDSVRSVLTAILNREGYKVHATADLQSAIAIVKNCHPDLLITNVMIPGGNGRETGKALRLLCPNMRVLIVAGLPDDDHIKQYWTGDDAFDLFPKPFAASQLATKVREVLTS